MIYTLSELRNGTGFTPGARFVQVSDERPGITFTREQVEAWVGFPLTDEQVAELEETLPNSSLPECVATVATEALGFMDPFDPEHDDWREATDEEAAAFHSGHWLAGLACRESEHGVEVREV